MRTILIAVRPPWTVAMHLFSTVLPRENRAEPAAVTCSWRRSVRPAPRNLYVAMANMTVLCFLTMKIVTVPEQVATRQDSSTRRRPFTILALDDTMPT